MNGIDNAAVTLQGVRAAEQVVYSYLQPTPLIHYQGLSDLIGANIYIKHENHQPGGSFKIRGGLNLMHHLKQEQVKGVITFSTGNHGISIAASASRFGIPATIVVPKGSNPEKKRLIQETGAVLIEAGDNFEEAARIGQEIQEREGLRFIHAANEPHLIHGVGTEFTEILGQLEQVDAIILPIGGGSELAAAITVVRELAPKVEVYAVQAAASQAAYQSWQQKQIVQAPNTTFAGGFATGSACELPFSIYRDYLSDFVLLSEEELIQGIRYALTYTHNLAEGAGASTIMAALKLKDRLRGKQVVLQMSGANETMEILQKVTAAGTAGPDISGPEM